MFHSYEASRRASDASAAPGNEENEVDEDEGTSLALASRVPAPKRARAELAARGAPSDEAGEPLWFANEVSAQQVRKHRGRVCDQEKLLVVGCACVDVIDTLPAFPREDGEYRSSSRVRSLGGNGANLARVASQLGRVCVSLLYATTDAESDPAGGYARAELEASGVTDLGVLTGGGDRRVSLPSSFILLCPGSRTIVHNRGRLPEVSLDDFHSVYIPFAFTWIHFEARPNARDTHAMMQFVQGTCTVSLELEKERGPEDVLALLAPLADLVIFSRTFVEGRGFSSAHAFLEAQLTRPERLRPNAKLAVAWGAQGAYGACVGADPREIFHQPAEPVREPLDTVGAGDTFNAALIVHLMRGCTLREAVRFACHVAAVKIKQTGFHDLLRAVESANAA
jgi:ketohexokinase